MLQPATSGTHTATGDCSARVNGIRLQYHESGDPAAPLAVVVHALMGHSRQWQPLADALSRRFRVLSFDQRGHGGSEWADDYSLKAFSDDTMGLVEHIAAGPARLIGHSLGAMVAMTIASRRPDLVSQVVLIDTGPESFETLWGRVDLPAALEESGDARFDDVDDAVDEWLASDQLAEERHLRRYLDHALARVDGGLGWAFDAMGLATFPASVQPDTLWNDVEHITAPTLIVRGAESVVLSRTDAQQLVDELSDARMVEIVGGGHDLGVQQPERVADAVAGFLSRTAPG